MIKIKKGLKLPISGEPQQKISKGNSVKTVALVGPDYRNMKPTMAVKVGDKVKLGQVLFEDKKNPGVLFTAPGSGTIIAVNRGEKRVFLSVVIQLQGDEAESFGVYEEGKLSQLERVEIQDNLLRSGMWTAFKTRPFSKSPQPGSTPNSIFVTAMDTNPLAPDPEIFLSEHPSAFVNGLKLLSKLTDGKTYLCIAPNSNIPGKDLSTTETITFSGPHPAGLAGTHIHHLDPVHAQKTVWSINYQDVVAIGYLFTTGKLFVERIVSLAGPQVKNPRLIKTRTGASIDDLIKGETKTGNNRVISGSVLSGLTANKELAFLGRFHNQISILEEGFKRDFLGWLAPGFNKFSIKQIFISKLFPTKKFNFTTSEEGSTRAMVPIGMYEKVMPLDIQPTFLLRSLITKDTDKAQALGCLELEEEDLGLCTFVCPGKYNYGSILRENLTQIEREG